MLGVQRLESRTRNVRVDLRCRNVGMPKEELYDTQIRAVIQQVGGERVAQAMRAQRRLDRSAGGISLDQDPEHLATHRTGALRNEQRV